jgi:hypothetical protein
LAAWTIGDVTAETFGIPGTVKDKTAKQSLNFFVRARGIRPDPA